jgi:hypothetical protein
MNTQSPLFPVMLVVLFLIVVSQMVVHFIKAVAAVSSYLISKCDTISDTFIPDLLAGYYAV